MSIVIERLCYVVVATCDLGASSRFASSELGLLPLTATAGEQAFRSDERQYSVLYSTNAPHGGVIGLELHDEHALHAALHALQEHGIQGRRDAVLAMRRNVRHLVAATTPGGINLELVVRPQHQGRRFFPSRDSGIIALEAISLRSTDVDADQALLTGISNVVVRDWTGEAAYLGLDAAHHRLALFPAVTAGVLAVEFAVDGLDQVMQQYWRLRDQPHAIAHGPGRRPVSQQVFVTFTGPDAVYYSFVTEGERFDACARRPRQFAMSPDSHCAWGSACTIVEMAPLATRPRQRILRGVPSP